MIFVCIVDRFHAGLNHLLESAIRERKEFCKDFSVLLVSNAKTAEERNSIRKSAFDLNLKTKVKTDCLDRREILSYISRCSRYSWVNQDLMKYAMLGGYGSLCNAALLSSYGHNAFVFDSRIKFDFAKSAKSNDSLRIIPRSSAGYDPVYSDQEETWIFDSLTDADSKVHRTGFYDLFCDFSSVLNCCTSDLQKVFGCFSGECREGSVFAASLGEWGMTRLKSSLGPIVSRRNSSFSSSDEIYFRLKNSKVFQRSAQSWTSGNFKAHAFFAGKQAADIPFLPCETASGGLFNHSLYGELANISKLGSSFSSPFSVRIGDEEGISYLDPLSHARKIELVDLFGILVSMNNKGEGIGRIGSAILSGIDVRKFVVSAAKHWSQLISESIKNKIMQGVGSSNMISDMSLMSDSVLRILDSSDLDKRIDIVEYILPQELSYSKKKIDALKEEIVNFGKMLEGWDQLVSSVNDLKRQGIKLGAYL